MDRRLLLWTAAIAALLAAAGLLWLDRPIAEFVRAAGIEQARVFAFGLAALDTITALSVWFWGIGCVALAIGLVGIAFRREDRWPRALIAAAIVQFATIETMILGKEYFGRTRPQQVLDSGDWSNLWFAAGTSFPSGHSAFYFGLLLPLAAACPIRWLRIVLIAIPVYVVLARIDLHKHFLSDVSTSALIAATYSLIVATLIRRWLLAPVRA
jgi:membrane-associated phospholipid phosphatase